VSAELCVFFSCADALFALPAARVGRLLLPRDVDDGDVDGQARRPGVTWIGDAPHALWDLGALLGRRAPPGGWITIDVPHGRERVAIALRTGPCLVVRRLADRLPAPAGLFVRRTAAFPSIFRADTVIASSGHAVGIVLDVDQLWTRAELAASATELLKASS